MNIIHLRASNFYGGPERQLHNHALLSRARDYRLSVCSFSESGSDPDFIKMISADGIDTAVVKVDSAYARSAVGDLRRHLVDHDTDILCTHDYRSHLIGYLASRSIRTKWVAFSRGWTQENLKIRLYQLLEKCIVRMADRIVAVSHAQAAKLRRLFVPHNKIVVIHNAVDFNLEDQIEQLDIRTDFDLPQNAVICLTAGRFSKEKGQLHFIESIASAVRQDNQLRFVLFGDGPDLVKARELVRAKNLTAAVVTPGHSADILRYMKGADVVVNPSLSEGLPNVVLEGMALRRAVIATNVGGVPELIEDGASGLLVRPKDASAMTEAILRLSDNRHFREQIGEAALRTVREKFTFENQTNQLATLYGELAG